MFKLAPVSRRKQSNRTRENRARNLTLDSNWAGKMVRKAQEKAKAKGRELRAESTRMRCAHCRMDAVIRTSWEMTILMRETTYACTNPECGHTFVALTEVHRTLSPSATPDPAINIPLSSHIRRDSMRVVLDHAGEAAHQPRYTPPVTGDLFANGPPRPD